MFALMAVLVIYVVLGGGTTDNFRALLISYMKALTNLPVSQSPLSEYKWALASITVNFFTILLTLPQLFRANSQRYEQVAIFCLGGITLAHIISLPFTVIERFDFNIVVCLTYLVYSGLDYFGVRTARVRNDPAMFAFSFYPLWAIDLPSVLVITFFLLAAPTVGVSESFYNGVGAGLLLLSGFVYIGITTFILPERLSGGKGKQMV
jgi:hypothetical protein